MEKILQPFYSTKKAGTGLGLAISNRIIEAHRGRIHVSSREGEGSSFVLEIPADLSEELVA
jgi:signal transduction histidine kinase